MAYPDETYRPTLNTNKANQTFPMCLKRKSTSKGDFCGFLLPYENSPGFINQLANDSDSESNELKHKFSNPF